MSGISSEVPEALRIIFGALEDEAVACCRWCDDGVTFEIIDKEAFTTHYNDRRGGKATKWDSVRKNFTNYGLYKAPGIADGPMRFRRTEQEMPRAGSDTPQPVENSYFARGRPDLLVHVTSTRGSAATEKSAGKSAGKSLLAPPRNAKARRRSRDEFEDDAIDESGAVIVGRGVVQDAGGHRSHRRRLDEDSAAQAEESRAKASKVTEVAQFMLNFLPDWIRPSLVDNDGNIDLDKALLAKETLSQAKVAESNQDQHLRPPAPQGLGVSTTTPESSLSASGSSAVSSGSSPALSHVHTPSASPMAEDLDSFIESRPPGSLESLTESLDAFSTNTDDDVFNGAPSPMEGIFGTEQVVPAEGPSPLSDASGPISGGLAEDNWKVYLNAGSSNAALLTRRRGTGVGGGWLVLLALFLLGALMAMWFESDPTGAAHAANAVGACGVVSRFDADVAAACARITAAAEGPAAGAAAVA